MFNVAIIGAEGFNNDKVCTEKIIKILQRKAKEPDGITILSTGDEFVKKFSDRFRIDIKVYFTDFKKYGKNALKFRNEELLSDSNAIIIFNDMKNDTNYIYEMAKKRNIPLRYITI